MISFGFDLFGWFNREVLPEIELLQCALESADLER
jgi:hypothetical protein